MTYCVARVAKLQCLIAPAVLLVIGLKNKATQPRSTDFLLQERQERFQYILYGMYTLQYSYVPEFVNSVNPGWV